MTDMMDKVLPQNIDAEQSVLGALFLDRGAIAKVARFLKAEDFYLEGHRQIYEAILSLEENGRPVDLVTVVNWLRDKEVLERIGGATYVASLASMLPTAANVEYHARIIEEKALLRNLIQIATRIAGLGYEGGESVERLMDEAERMLLELTTRRSSSVFTSIKDLLMEVLKYIEERYQNKGSISGVSSGFLDVDRLCCGMQPGDLLIVAGRPAMGKTSFALTVAHHVALHHQLPVAVFSLEMSKEQLVQRILCSEAMVDQQKVRSGYLGEGDWARLTQAAVVLSRAPLYIDDSALLSVRQIRAKANRLQQEKGLGLVVIDYLQLMQAGQRAENRQQEITEISRSLKGLAKDLKVPVLALAQLSRQVEQRQDKRPIMSDLRDSGSIEQDADVVMFIYREEYYKPDTEKKGITEIIVAKQRNGPTGVVELAFLKEFTRFMNLAKQEDTNSDMVGNKTKKEKEVP
jgi:replicative DNA helicase